MTTTKAKLEFVHAMARRTRATVRQCEALLRYAGTLRNIEIEIGEGYDRHGKGATAREEEAFYNRLTTKHERIQSKAAELCDEFLMIKDNIWKLTAPDSKRIHCQCGKMAIYGRSPNGGAPFWYECRDCFPYGAVFDGAVLKIRVPDGGEVVVPA